VLAIKTDNTLWGWGLNDAGQIGDGTLDTSTTPVKVGFGFTEIATGFGHSLAVDIEGGLWSWGANEQGQLGNGRVSATTVITIPQQIGTGFRQVAAGGAHSLAIDGVGALWSWGANTVGQLGDGTTTDSAVPTRRGGPYKAIAAGWEFSLATQPDGSLWSWGSNALGQLGTGSAANTTLPGKVGANYVEAAGGAEFAIARKADGTVWVWGSTSFGLSGNHEAVNFSTPEQVGTGYADASAGMFHTLALKSDGSLWAWGRNDFGQLGTGNTTDRSSAVQVGSGYAVVAAGAFHSLGVKSDGGLWAWGANNAGQIGTGKDADALAPVLIGGGFQDIATGLYFSLALKADGSLWTWGANDFGQLGDGSSNQTQSTPKRIGSGIYQAIAAGTEHALALKTNGELWAWGKNKFGQLGVGNSQPNAGLPQLVGSGFAQIAAGSEFSLAIKTDGSLWVWGYNGYGQIGNGTDTDVNTPVRIGDGFTGLSGGGGHAVASKADGTLWMWGNNASGQLGDGTFAQRPMPVLVVDTSATGFFNVSGQATAKVPPALNVPFFLKATGDVSASVANLNTSTRFAPAAFGKSGAVYVTASVPAGSSLAQSARPASAALGARPNKLAGTTPPGGFTLLQLTPSGWQTVVNGQLIPYTSGVLGDQLAAQTILNNTDTSNLKGAEFCVGYGTTAADMVANGNIRAVATIPGATTTASCVVGGSISVPLGVAPGWNLLGNPVNQSIAVATQFGDAVKVNSVWKWDSTAAKWRFYTPGMSAAELQRYAASQGCGVLNEIQAGDGYWVNAKTQADLGTVTGAAINLRQSSLSTGWNLVATAGNVTPQDFNLSLSTTPPTAGQVPVNLTSLWTWDSAQSRWYFYAPSLEETALTSHIQDQGYRHFGKTGKTVGDGAGFWVRRP
jgi:alpha-tubulin suppressor-like RCC1 family protein